MVLLAFAVKVTVEGTVAMLALLELRLTVTPLPVAGPERVRKSCGGEESGAMNCAVLGLKATVKADVTVVLAAG